MLAGLPGWRELLTQMAEAIRSADALTANQMVHYVAKGSLTKAADFFRLTEDVVDGDKRAIMQKLLNKYDSKPLIPLASLPFRSVLTTNFDRSILDAIAIGKKQAPRDYRLGDATFSQAVWETELHVTRIHGCIESPDSMVLSDAQFVKLLDSDQYIDLLSHAFLHKQVVFLGFSFYDPAIKYVFEQLDKRFGPASPGRHLAILPEANASELIQKAARLNITVVRYDEVDHHAELWDGIAQYATSIKTTPEKNAVVANHPYASTKQYLAACYARVSVASEHTPLREIVIEGVLSASLQESHPKSLGLLDLHEIVRKTLGIRGKNVEDFIGDALKSLTQAKLVRKHKDENSKGTKFAWIGEPDNTSTLGDAIQTIKNNILNRAHVQEGWQPPPHVADVIGTFLKEIIHRRGWDLGAAFAAGKAPDNISFRTVLAECGQKLSAFDRERIERTVESLFQRPTAQEAALLGELGRVSFVVELTFRAPHTTLLHRTTLPHRIYFDANLLLPTFIEGHPHHRTYTETLNRILTASTTSGNKLQLVAYSGYLNEMISHRNSAIALAKEAGAEFEALARSDALFHGPGNINVYVGAYVSALENGHPVGFMDFLKRVAPYVTETDLRRWVEKKGFIVIESPKNSTYGTLYPYLEKRNASRLSNGKQPILIEHDALQLSLLEGDCRKGDRALFVTADRQLYEDVVVSQYGHLAEFMVSHIGIVQMVDILTGLKSDDRALGELLWSSKVSERSQRIRSFLTVEALSKYDAGLAMTMHAVVEAQSEAISKQLEREGMDLEAQDPKARVKALKSLGALENNFFAGMSEAMKKLKKK